MNQQIGRATSLERRDRHERERTTGATCVKVRSSSSEFKSNVSVLVESWAVRRQGIIRKPNEKEEEEEESQLN